jgi:cold shock CspA family protein
MHRLHKIRQSHQSRQLSFMQGVVKAYDPQDGGGLLIRDTDMSEYAFTKDALQGSVFRMLRPGQRVVFTVDAFGHATHLRLGSEGDMQTPGFPSA